MLVIRKTNVTRTPRAASNPSDEFLRVPLAQLAESPTNPRKSFDEAQLNELAESIRSHGILSPLVVRRSNGLYEIVAGARRYRAATRAGLENVPVRVVTLTDEEAAEAQLIENVQRSDIHPFEEAQGFRALLEREGPGYTIQTIAARVGKPAAHVARRLKLLDLIPPAAEALTAGRIGVEHASLIAKLTPDAQERALDHCFDGYGAGEDSERSLVPVSRLQAWMEHNLYLSLKSASFSKEDETLLPEAGSCAKCPKRTGFNTLLFGEAGANLDSCVDAACFNRKLDAHVAQRVATMPNLVQIAQGYASTSGTSALSRRDYVEVLVRRNVRTKNALPEQRLCPHLTTAIHVDGLEKGRLVKICANRECYVHFANRKKEEEQRRRWKQDRTAENRKAKQVLIFRHRVLAKIVKRVKAPLGCEELRFVTRFVLASLSHDLAARLAKRRGLGNAKEPKDWQAVERIRTLYKKLEAADLVPLLFEAILLSSVGNVAPDRRDDPLVTAAGLARVNVQAIRLAVAKEERKKEERKKKEKGPKKTHGH